MHVWVSLVFFAQRTTAMEKLPCIWDMSWYWTGMDEIISAETKPLVVWLSYPVSVTWGWLLSHKDPYEAVSWNLSGLVCLNCFGNECPQLLRTPQPVTVPRRILTFLVRNPFKPLLATVNGWTFSIGWWFSLTVLRFPSIASPLRIPFSKQGSVLIEFFLTLAGHTANHCQINMNFRNPEVLSVILVTDWSRFFHISFLQYPREI